VLWWQIDFYTRGIALQLDAIFWKRVPTAVSEEVKNAFCSVSNSVNLKIF
jgi:hypothetical protein